MGMTLKEHRAELCITQEEYAGMLGIEQRSFSRYELGQRIPCEAVARKIYLVSGKKVTPNDLYGLY